jgi:hypothetical protein
MGSGLCHEQREVVENVLCYVRLEFLYLGGYNRANFLCLRWEGCV